MMEELYEAMSKEQLEALREQFKANPTLVEQLDKAINAKAELIKQDKINKTFTEAVNKQKLPPPPTGIVNVLRSWAQVEEETGAEAEAVEIIDAQAVLNPDGTIKTPAVKHTETRKPTELVWKWVITLNHTCHTPKTSGAISTTSGGNATGKRAITVKKIEGERLTVIGNFSSASKACEFLKLPLGGDSGNRVLDRNGYVHLQYTGTDIKL